MVDNDDQKMADLHTTLIYMPWKTVFQGVKLQELHEHNYTYQESDNEVGLYQNDYPIMPHAIIDVTKINDLIHKRGIPHKP